MPGGTCLPLVPEIIIKQNVMPEFILYMQFESKLLQCVRNVQITSPVVISLPQAHIFCTYILRCHDAAIFPALLRNAVQWCHLGPKDDTLFF